MLFVKKQDNVSCRGPNSALNERTDLASIVVDDEALVPAVEVFMGVDLDSELLQHGLVGALAHSVHGGAHIIQDAHDAWRILGSRGKHFTLITGSTRHQEVTSLDFIHSEVD